MTTPIPVQNFETFKSIVQDSKLGDARLLEFIDSNAQELILAPASTRTNFVCAYPGGLIEHSLRVLSLVNKSVEAFGFDIPLKSRVLVSLFHDIGKLGTSVQPYYLPQDSQWHRDKLGQMYEVNPKYAHMPVSVMSLMHLANNAVQMSPDQWYAIASIGHKNLINDSVPSDNEPILATVLQHAVKLATIQGKGKIQASLVTFP